MEQKIEMEEDSVQSTSRSSLVALTPAMLAKLENDFTIGGGMGTWSGNRIVFANEKEATPKAAKKKRKLTKTEKKRLRAQGILIGKKLEGNSKPVDESAVKNRKKKASAAFDA